VPSDDDAARASVVMTSVSTLASSAFAVFAFWMARAYVPAATLFAWHPLCLSAAIGLCGAASVIGVRVRAFAPGRERVRALWCHLALNSAGGAAWVIGFWAIYANKNNLGKAHFTSAHGKVGAAATMVLVATYALGLFSFNALGLLTRLDMNRRAKDVKATHRVASLVAIFGGILAASMRTGHDSTGFGAAGRAVADVALFAGAGALAFLAATTPAWKIER
jgi:cytochrome b-561 domain-containing protein 2